MEVVASLSQGRTAAAQCGLFTYKSVPVIFEPPCTLQVHILLGILGVWWRERTNPQERNTPTKEKNLNAHISDD